MSYSSKAERWAIQVLEAVWAGQTPPKNRRLGADDLRRMVDQSTKVSLRFERLRALDDLIARVADDELADRGVEAPPVQETSRSVGAFTFSEVDSPQTFDRRISALWESAEDPLKDTRSFAWPAWAGLAAATAAAALLMVGGDQTAEPTEFTPRGVADAATSGLMITPYCLTQQESGLVETRAFTGTAPCPSDARIATSVTDSAGRELAVVLLGVQAGADRLNILPYSPSPSAPESVRLEVGATEQRIGPVRRLETNHETGALDVVAIALEEEADWSIVEPILSEIMETRAGANTEVIAAALYDGLKQAGAEPVDFAVTRSAIALP